MATTPSVSSRAGLEYTTQMLETVLLLGDPSPMDFQLRWARDRLPHDGVQPEHLLALFRIYREVVTELLAPGPAAEIIRYLDWMIARQQGLMGLA